MSLPQHLMYILASLIVFSGCASRVLQYDNAEKALKTEEFEKRLEVKEVNEVKPSGDAAATGSGVQATALPPAHAGDVASSNNKKTRKRKGKVTSPEHKQSESKGGTEAGKASTVHLPAMEDGAGFTGRRPLKDPFRIGEKVTLSLTYFKVTAGNLDLEVKPMVEVNGVKAYHFAVNARSNSFFNHIYGVDDQATTYMSYQDMVPLSLQISMKESKQLVEARTFFDWKALKASYWKKRVTKEHGEESKEIQWNIEAYSQNVITAVFYLRTFQFEVGKKLAFRVVDEGKNIVFKGEVIRKEKLDTEIGELDTLVIRPELTVDGNFAPVGEILIWLTDDDRKFPVRIESKIKIGTIVAKLKALDKGRE